MTERDATPDLRTRILFGVGLALHLLVGVFPYALSGLLAPPYGVAVAYLGWGGLMVMFLRMRSQRPWAMLLLPAAGLAWWFGLMAFGDLVLGWTA